MVSAKTPKTIVVEVVQTTKHKKYLKIFLQHRRYHVHDPRQMFHEGNTVTFVACRPISRTKRWLVVYNEAQNEKRKTKNFGNYSVPQSGTP